MARKVVLATNNAGKAKELNAMLNGLDMEIVAQSALQVPGVEETGLTFIENAILKARNASAHAKLPAIADDSGLEVDALGGRPGIHSARFHKSAPRQDGCAALLDAMKDVPDGERSARFRAVVVLIEPGGQEHAFEGVCTGSIGFEKRGTGGFGFDPVFRLEGDTQHLAELSSAEKHAVTHRGKAARQVLEFLAARCGS